jgi:hypothetical protein
MNPDINGQLTALTLCAKRVAVGAGTQTFAGVDLRDFINNCKIVIAHNELSGSGSTSIQYSLLDSADNTTFAASAGLPTVAANTAASPTLEIALDTRNCKRYVQLKALTSSTTATFDIGAFAIGLKQIS